MSDSKEFVVTSARKRVWQRERTSPLRSFTTSPVFSSAVPVLLYGPLSTGIQRRRAAVAANCGGKVGPGHTANPPVQCGTVPSTAQNCQEHQGLGHHGEFRHASDSLKVIKFAFSRLRKV